MTPLLGVGLVILLWLEARQYHQLRVQTRLLRRLLDAMSPNDTEVYNLTQDLRQSNDALAQVVEQHTKE